MYLKKLIDELNIVLEEQGDCEVFVDSIDFSVFYNVEDIILLENGIL
jgi:hypothetical protein